MTTNTNPTFPPSRRQPRQVTNTLKRILNYNDGDAGTASFADSLPAGAVITNVMIVVLTAFNGGTTNTLTVGQNSSTYNDMATTGDSNLAVTGTYVATRGLGLAAVINSATDVAVITKYAQTGTAATAGKALILIEFEGGWAS